MRACEVLAVLADAEASVVLAVVVGAVVDLAVLVVVADSKWVRL